MGKVRDAEVMKSPVETPYPKFKGSPRGWEKLPLFRQQKLLAENPQWRDALDEALKNQGRQEVEPEPEAMPVPIVIDSEITIIPAPKPMGSKPKAHAKRELTDIRDWWEDVDGISGDRIRNCIIYQLDYGKSTFYQRVLSVGFLKRVMKSGITGAQKIHEDTPPGWVYDPDPLEIVHTVIEDGKEVQKKEYRRYKTPKEKKHLLKLAFNSRGKINEYFIPRLVDKNCPECRGTGYCLVSQYPNDPRYSFIRKNILCRCVTRIPAA